MYISGLQCFHCLEEGLVGEVNGVFVGKVGDDLGREEFGLRGDALGLKVGGIGLEPAAESVGRNACKKGELGFGVGFHCFGVPLRESFYPLNGVFDSIKSH